MSVAPVFSIIVPIYKVEKYLDQCVQSLINQTYPEIEILLVDDGSPDRCPAMCDVYAQRDARVRVIHKENGGLSDARNAGMDAASGVYLIFVDSDDWITLDTCERLLPLTRDGYDILVGEGVCEGAKMRLSHGYTTGCVSGAEYLKLALRRGSMPMAAVLYVYKRTFLQNNQLRFKYGIAHEDEEFTPRAFLAAQRVMESNVCFYHYMIRENSITTRKDLRKNGEDLYATCLELKHRYEKLEDKDLKVSLLDSLVVKYLSLFQAGRLYQYGRAYVHRRFVMQNAYFPKTRCKAWLFALSPRLYWHINDVVKRHG